MTKLNIFPHGWKVNWVDISCSYGPLTFYGHCMRDLFSSVFKSALQLSYLCHLLTIQHIISSQIVFGYENNGSGREINGVWYQAGQRVSSELK